jgi:hypothetical protein
MERYAHALNTSITEVSPAFAADSRLALDDCPAHLTGEKIELLALFRRSAIRGASVEEHRGPRADRAFHT